MNILFKKGASSQKNLDQISKVNAHGFELIGMNPFHVKVSDSAASPLLKRIKDEYVGNSNGVRTFF